MSTPTRIYQFKVTLKDVDPPIWRRIQVPEGYTFWDLHVAIQDAMGWLDCHLHAFHVVSPTSGLAEEIGIPDEESFEGDTECLPGWSIPISNYFLKPGVRVQYDYDFGDGWEHEVVLEDIAPRIAKQKYPRCLDGARACPPEDCGGTVGFDDLLKRIRDPEHEEHATMIEWLGREYDADAFAPETVHFDDPKARWKHAFTKE